MTDIIPCCCSPLIPWKRMLRPQFHPRISPRKKKTGPSPGWQDRHSTTSPLLNHECWIFLHQKLGNRKNRGWHKIFPSWGFASVKYTQLPQVGELGVSSTRNPIITLGLGGGFLFAGFLGGGEGLFYKNPPPNIDIFKM